MKFKITSLVLFLSLFNFNGHSQCNGAQFEEQNGIVVIEAESGTLPTGWVRETGTSGYTGSSFIAWRGADYFNSPGNGLISYKIKINSPGKYRFQWRNKVGIGTDGSEHNDSWLKFPDAFDFYGQNGTSIKYPNGGTFKKSNVVVNGSSANGWLKIFTTNAVSNFSWTTLTSDNNGHSIYAEFNAAGVYTMQVSARSKGHFIDRMVLYKESSYTSASATALTRTQTNCGGTVVPPPPPTGTPSISSVQFINANSDVVLGNLTNGTQINLAIINNSTLTFIATTSPATIGSVKLDLTGPQNFSNTDNSAPYSLFGESGSDYVGRALPVGNYTLKVNPYTGTNATGTKGNEVTITFSVVNNTTTPPPTSGPSVASVQYINSNNENVLGNLTNGTQINLASINNSELTFRATTSPATIGSVRFQLTGTRTYTRTDSGAPPYSMVGENGSNYFGLALPVGNYTLKVNPYSGSNATGTKGNEVTITFSVVNGTTTPPPTPQPTANFSFVLVNSTTNQDISTLINGSTVANGSNINIRAVSRFSNTASVYFVVQGPSSRTFTENVAPYALFGDINGNYTAGSLANGNYSLTTTAYTGRNRTGTNLGSTTINFTVGTSAATSAKVAAFAYPNPIEDSKLSVKLPQKEYGTVNYSLKNSSGVEVETGQAQVITSDDKADVNLSSFDRIVPGVYYLTVHSLNGTYTIPIIKK